MRYQPNSKGNIPVNRTISSIKTDDVFTCLISQVKTHSTDADPLKEPSLMPDSFEMGFCVRRVQSVFGEINDDNTD